MGGILAEPIKNKNIKQGKNNEFEFAAIEMQGWRTEMEDAAIFQPVLQTNKKQQNSLFAVFDGHGGFEVSKFLKETFVSVLTNTQSYVQGQYEEALRQTFKKLDELLMSDKGEKRLKQIRAQNQGELTLQGEIISKGTGSTGNVVLITKSKIFVANIGDSRSALFRDGQTVALSIDHKPENEKQYQRIQKAGGQVIASRVNGQINLSRAFGDFEYKANEKLGWSEQIITSQPDIKVIDRNINDSFILIGCDGVWQRYEHQSSGLMLKINNMPEFKQGKYEKCLETLFEELISSDPKASQFGLDNMTAILIKFNEI